MPGASAALQRRLALAHVRRSHVHMWAQLVAIHHDNTHAILRYLTTGSDAATTPTKQTDVKSSAPPVPNAFPNVAACPALRLYSPLTSESSTEVEKVDAFSPAMRSQICLELSVRPVERHAGDDGRLRFPPVDDWHLRHGGGGWFGGDGGGAGEEGVPSRLGVSAQGDAGEGRPYGPSF